MVLNGRNVSVDIFYVLRSMEEQNWPLEVHYMFNPA